MTDGEGGIEARSTLASFDADGALAAVREALGEDLRIVVEYDHQSYNVLYAAPRIVDEYGGSDQLHGRLRRIHLYLRMDYIEQLLLKDLRFEFGRVEAATVYMDHAIFVRVYAGDEALLVTVEPDASGEAVVDVLSDHLERAGN